MCFYSVGLSDITITGTSTVAIGKLYTYICSAVCIPSCTFTWEYIGETFQGDQIQIPILPDGTNPNDYKTESLTCEVTNTATQVTITATKNLTVTGESDDVNANHIIMQGDIGVQHMQEPAQQCWKGASLE